MVAKNDLVIAKDAIEEALKRYVGNGGPPRVLVVETKWGHLHAMVGSDRFKDMGLGGRLETVWEYLRQHVDRKLLAMLYGITAVDDENYDQLLREADRRAILGWASESRDLYVHGVDREPPSND